MTDNVKLGDFVRVMMTNAVMFDVNGYRGSYNKGDVAEVTRTTGLGHGINLDGESGCPFWMEPSFVEVVGNEFDSRTGDHSAGDVFLVLEDHRFYSKGETVTVVPAECGCCSWAVEGSDGEHHYTAEGLPPMALLTKATAVEAPLFSDPAPTPMPFMDMGDDERGFLLLSKFEGKPIQLFNPLVGEWMDDDDEFIPEIAYRAKPDALIAAEKAAADAAERAAALKAEINRLEYALD